MKDKESWTQKPFIEQVKHVWYDHGNLFSSRIREEMDGDKRAMELAENFEESWREFHDYILKEKENHDPPKTQEERLKERLKPLIHEKLEERR